MTFLDLAIKEMFYNVITINIIINYSPSISFYHVKETKFRVKESINCFVTEKDGGIDIKEDQTTQKHNLYIALYIFIY